MRLFVFKKLLPQIMINSLLQSSQKLELRKIMRTQNLESGQQYFRAKYLEKPQCGEHQCSRWGFILLFFNNMRDTTTCLILAKLRCTIFPLSKIVQKHKVPFAKKTTQPLPSNSHLLLATHWLLKICVASKKINLLANRPSV